MRYASINVHIAIALLVSMIGVLGGIYLLTSSQSQLLTIVEADAGGIERVRTLSRYQLLTQELVTNLRAYSTSRDASWLARFDITNQELERTGLQIQALFRDDPMQMKRFSVMAAQVRLWMDQVAAPVRQNVDAPTRDQVLAKQDELTSTINSLTREVSTDEDQRQIARSRKLQEAAGHMNQIFNGLAAIIVMGLLILWRWSLGAIRRPLLHLENSLTSIARGDASSTLDQKQLPAEFHGVLNAYHNVCRHIVEKAESHSMELEKLNEQLLKGLIPICSQCKKIRTERGQWVPIENYIHSRTQADFTHALCQDCLRRALADA